MLAAMSAELDDLVHDIFTRFRMRRELDGLLLSTKQKQALERVRNEIAYSRSSAREMKATITEILANS